MGAVNGFPGLVPGAPQVLHDLTHGVEVAVVPGAPQFPAILFLDAEFEPGGTARFTQLPGQIGGFLQHFFADPVKLTEKGRLLRKVQVLLPVHQIDQDRWQQLEGGRFQAGSD